MGNSVSDRPSSASPLPDPEKPQNILFNVSSPDIAIVDVTIQPDVGGRVRYQGSFWPAESSQGNNILKGKYVKVIGRNNITLLVEEVSNPNSN